MPTNTDLDIYVVSLQGDHARRAAMRARFGEAWGRMQVVDAVDLRSDDAAGPATLPAPGRRARRHPMTRAETGCALSHMQVMERFLRGDAGCCLVLEDDAEGRAADVARVSTIMQALPADAIVVLGGQQGLRNRRYLYGMQVAEGLWRIPPACRRFMARTCCYALTRAAARIVLSRQRYRLERADQWNVLLRGHRHVYFADVFRHPEDMAASRIEAARHATRGGALSRIGQDGVFYTLGSALLKAALPVLGPLLDCQRIPQGDAGEI